jgi:hypothetical protein
LHLQGVLSSWVLEASQLPSSQLREGTFNIHPPKTPPDRWIQAEPCSFRHPPPSRETFTVRKLATHDQGLQGQNARGYREQEMLTLWAHRSQRGLPVHIVHICGRLPVKYLTVRVRS